jgi:hypothetical protein
MTRLLLIIFFFEVGLVLAIVPWSMYWERNYFVALVPMLQVVVTNYFFRGAVSGLGLVNLAAAVFELRSLLAARRSGDQMFSLHQPPSLDE